MHSKYWSRRIEKTVAVGKFFKPFGIKGEVRFKPYFPDYLHPSLIKEGMAINIDKSNSPIAVEVTSWREMSNFFAFTIKGYSSPEDVSCLTNRELFVNRDEFPELPNGQYLADELVGLRIVKENGVEIGTVKNIIETGANSVIELKLKNGGEAMLPFIDEVVLSVDIAEGVITVKLMEGLIDEN